MTYRAPRVAAGPDFAVGGVADEAATRVTDGGAAVEGEGDE